MDPKPRISDQHTCIQDLKDWMTQFVSERDWEKFHNAKNLCMSMAIETSELMEHFQWLTTQEVESATGYNRDEVEEEMADVACYLVSLANALDIDLAQAIDRKMVKNRVKYPAE